MKRLLYTSLGLFLLVAAFAPLLANDMPIVARVGGQLCFPAFYTYIGERPEAPEMNSWKKWWIGLEYDASGEDWAVMPFIPYGPSEPHTNLMNHGPSLGVHYMGNDDTGRDVLARVIHGATTAVIIGFCSGLLAVLIGVPLGMLAGYYGGVLDFLISRLIEIFLCFPAIFFALAVLAFLGSSTTAVVVVLGLLYWTSFARIVRGEFLSLRERDFVKSARGLGVGTLRLLFCHLLPSASGPLLVNAAFVAASAIVVESTLSFLGLGAGLSTVSWGSIIHQGKLYAQAGAWHLWLFPSLALIATVVSLHGLADLASRQGLLPRADRLTETGAPES